MRSSLNRLTHRTSTVVSPNLDYTVPNLEHTKPGNLPIEMLIDVGRHNLKL